MLLRFFQLTLLLSLFSCGHLTRQKSPDVFYPKNQKVVLFDGKKLGYWKKSNFVHPGKIEVVDSAIVLGMGG